MRETAPRVALLSLEPWDEVERRNQHLVHELLRSGAVSSVLWVSPPAGGLAVRARTARPVDGLTVVVPPLLVPRRWGGHRVLGRWLRHAVRDVDLLWVNDPVAGRSALRAGVPALYDVTDDWRSMTQDAASRARLVAAEDVLARRAATVVCSQVLADRWLERYGVRAALVPNGVDVQALRTARPRDLGGAGPHAVYVGTAHESRLDVDLCVRLARDSGAVLHLVGPDHLTASQRARLLAAGVRLHGAVPAREVPSWLVAADVLVCPHLVDDFTRSLDAIKAHEYLATDRPVVATPSCGFQHLVAPGLRVAAAEDLVAAAAAALGTGPFDRPPAASWSDRAARFAELLTDRPDRAVVAA